MAKVVSLLPEFLDQSDLEPTPNGNGEPTFNAVIVSGAGSTEVNGTYTERGIDVGKRYYNLVGQPDSFGFYLIRWDGSSWRISADDEDLYMSGSDTEFPWDAVWEVSNGVDPVPTFTPTNV